MGVGGGVFRRFYLVILFYIVVVFVCVCVFLIKEGKNVIVAWALKT